MDIVQTYIANQLDLVAEGIEVGYTELVNQIRYHLMWDNGRPSKSTISRWMAESLSGDPYDPKNPRLYTSDDIRAILCWAHAGLYTRRGSKANRFIRRQNIFMEVQKEWQLRQQKKC